MEKTFVASTWVVKARNASRETQWTRLDFFIVSGSNILFKKSVDLKQGWEAAGGEAEPAGGMRDHLTCSVTKFSSPKFC